jgi:hypothetical protein
MPCRRARADELSPSAAEERLQHDHPGIYPLLPEEGSKNRTQPFSRALTCGSAPSAALIISFELLDGPLRIIAALMTRSVSAFASRADGAELFGACSRYRQRPHSG